MEGDSQIGLFDIFKGKKDENDDFYEEPWTATCDYCDGTGIAFCDVCDGEGGDELETCSACNGSGGMKCPECDGLGESTFQMGKKL